MTQPADALGPSTELSPLINRAVRHQLRDADHQSLLWDIGIVIAMYFETTGRRTSTPATGRRCQDPTTGETPERNRTAPMIGLTPDITAVTVIEHGILRLTFADGLSAQPNVLDRH
jgi:hypothetical protein